LGLRTLRCLAGPPLPTPATRAAAPRAQSEDCGVSGKWGFNLQLSGHTHAGQFFPWTVAVRFVPCAARRRAFASRQDVDLCERGSRHVGALVRFGTEPELTVPRLVHVAEGVGPSAAAGWAMPKRSWIPRLRWRGAPWPRPPVTA